MSDIRSRVVVVGEGGCGKSALSLCFVAGTFIEEYDPTIEDSYTQTIIVDGEAAIIEIIDTAGQDELSAMRATWYSKASAFLICFSLVDRGSLEQASCFREEILRVAEAYDCPTPVILLCGTKSDLVSSTPMASVVTQADISRLTKAWNCNYIETSAKKATNVTKTFEQIVRDIRISQERMRIASMSKKGTKKAKTAKSCSIL